MDNWEYFKELTPEETLSVDGGGFINDMFNSAVGGAALGGVIGGVVFPGVGAVGGVVIGGLYGFVAGSIGAAVDISHHK